MFACRGWGIDRLAAHAHQLRIAALAFKGELSCAGAVIKNQTECVHIRLRGGLVVPVDFRCDIRQLFLTPVALLRRSNSNIPVGAAADVFRVDPPVICLIPGFGLDLTRDFSNQFTELFPTQFNQILADRIFRLKYMLFDLPHLPCRLRMPLTIQCIVSQPSLSRQGF